MKHKWTMTYGRRRSTSRRTAPPPPAPPRRTARAIRAKNEAAKSRSTDNFSITDNKYDIIYIRPSKTGGGSVSRTLREALGAVPNCAWPPGPLGPGVPPFCLRQQRIRRRAGAAFNWMTTTHEQPVTNNAKTYKECHNYDLSNAIDINPRYLKENNPDTIYILSIRNPIRRFKSAFYHHYNRSNAPGVCKRWKATFNKSNIVCINTFLDKLFSNGSINKEIENRFIIGHLKFGLDKYLKHFLNQQAYSNIIVILTENLENDIVKKLKIDRNKIIYMPHSFAPKNRDTSIHKEHIINLKKYLENDYKIIVKLRNLKLLTHKEYGLLIE